jgi:hypothetical protein|tara:strand:- start:168 stop:602 length:435 start_codon:yes stop_codon:yes gene_type:complete
MTLDDIRKEIERDVRLDETALDIESLKIPQLHSKYLNFLMDERLSLAKITSDYDTTLRIKWEYYTGKMSQEQLTAHGWEPFALRVLRNDLDLYLNSDADISKARQRVVYQKEKISLLEEIVKELNNRHWKIRNAIDWRKFVNGQ